MRGWLGAWSPVIHAMRPVLSSILRLAWPWTWLGQLEFSRLLCGGGCGIVLSVLPARVLILIGGYSFMTSAMVRVACHMDTFVLV